LPCTPTSEKTLETNTIASSEFDDLINDSPFTSQDKYSESNRHTPSEMSPVSMQPISLLGEPRSDSSLVKSIEVAQDSGDQPTSPGTPDQTVVAAAAEVDTLRSPNGTEHFQTSSNEEVPAVNNNTEANTPKSVGSRLGSKAGRRWGRTKGRQRPVSSATEITTVSSPVSTSNSRSGETS
jgi:hypothetical protein